MNLRQEWIEGRLCEKGFLKESYDEQAQDLKRTFTHMGFNAVRTMLNDPNWRSMFKMMLLQKGIPEEAHESLINKILEEEL